MNITMINTFFKATIIIPLLFSCNHVKTYQTFDEFSMSGVGKAVERPCVFVYKSDKKIIVRRTDKMNTPIVYTLKDDVWYNEQSFYLWKNTPFYTYTISEKNTPNIYYRFIKSDTIIEYCECSDHDFVLRNLIIRTRNDLTTINIDGLFPNFSIDHDNMLADLKLIMSTYKKKANKIISTFKDDPVARLDKFFLYDTYTRDFKNDSLFFVPSPHSYGKTIKYKLSSLGEYGTLPGIKYYDGLDLYDDF